MQTKLNLVFRFERYTKLKLKDEMTKAWDVKWMAHAALTKAAKSMHGWTPAYGN